MIFLAYSILGGTFVADYCWEKNICTEDIKYNTIQNSIFSQLHGNDNTDLTQRRGRAYWLCCMSTSLGSPPRYARLLLRLRSSALSSGSRVKSTTHQQLWGVTFPAVCTAHFTYVQLLLTSLCHKISIYICETCSLKTRKRHLFALMFSECFFFIQSGWLVHSSARIGLNRF